MDSKGFDLVKTLRLIVQDGEHFEEQTFERRTC
jgi:hypothetical protein